jgi:hypothetical protein
MKCGMCMSLAFVESTESQAVQLLGGYEDGSVAMWDAGTPASPLAILKIQGDPVMAIAAHGRGRGRGLFCHKWICKVR